MNRLNKTLVVICALFLHATINAQSINYQIAENDPAFNGIMIMPFIGTYSSLAKSFSLGGGGEVIVRKLPVHLRAYADISLIDGGLLATSDGNFDKGKIFEFGGEFPLFSSSAPKTRRVVLKSEYATSTSNLVTSIDVDGVAVEKSTLVRGGLFTFNGHFDEYIFIEDRGTEYGVGGTHHVTGFYAGISKLTRKNIVIETEQYGKTRNTSYVQLYADLLIGASVDLGTWDVLARSSYDIKDDLNVETRNLGFRAGLYYQFPGFGEYSTNGWGIKSEIGLRPGPVSESKFLLVNVFYAFNIK